MHTVKSLKKKFKHVFIKKKLHLSHIFLKKQKK